MKRRTRPDNAAKFSLFPFLAVLLCVMGALIVLLIVIAQRTHDRAAAHVASTEDANRLRQEREELAWRLVQVRKSRDETANQLAEQRASLSHVEDHARRLRDQYHALQQSARDLEESLKSPSTASREIDDQLAAIQMRMNEVQEQLKAKRLAPLPAAGYAIIPYEGPNGTQRRPMYIECCEDGIILQPEGVTLTASDFLGPLGPGNPLAAAMRAAREYLYKRRAAGGPDPGEPYPLLLIRPDGIEAYYVAREALTSWGSEFGYEFVDQDWKLEYPEPDPTLLAIVKAAAEDARQRQQLLARIAPKAFEEAEEGGAVYRASPTSGGVMVDGSGRRSGRRGGGTAQGGGARGGSGHQHDHGKPRGAGGPDEEGEGLPGYAGLEDDDASAPRTRGGFKRSGGKKPNGSSTPGATGQEGTPSDGSPEMQLASRNSKNKPGEKGAPLKPGQYVPKPMSMQRGQNWGLKDAGPSAVPISRKIRVRCEPTQLVIVTNDRGATSEQAIPLAARTEETVEELVSSVWKHMDRWGMAGNNMYWKPQLQFEVTPETRPRYEEIKALLDGSGLEVAERTATGTARTPGARK